MHNQCVIIGGGTAGLAAAIKLTELNIQPLVIEANSYPQHKICGEFFSTTTAVQLKKWGLNPVEIDTLHIPTHKIVMPFPQKAGSLSHFIADAFLAEKAAQAGATFLINRQVTQHLLKDNKHLFQLSSGEEITADQCILATGRLPHFKSTANFPYYGFKTHYEGLNLKNSLEMFLFPGAYIGISPIEEGKFNVACLVKKELFNSWKDLIHHLLKQNEQLQERLAPGRPLFDWMQAPLPEFGIRPDLNLPETYCIGDAAGTIPPITGNGLSMAIQGGILAAEYVRLKDSRGFREAWKKRYASSIYLGKLLHKIALSPALSSSFELLVNYFPSLLTKAYTWTR